MIFKSKISQKEIEHSRELETQKQNLMKQIDKLKTQNHEIIPCPNGIFNYLFNKHKINPIKIGLIGIEGNSYDSDWEDDLPDIIDPSFKSYWLPEEKENSYFQIDFKTFSIQINKYHIYTGDECGRFIFKNWILSGITENNQEIILDTVNNCQEITSNHPETTINITNSQFIRSVKFTIKGKNEIGNYTYDIRNIEFYGHFKYFDK